MSEPGIAGSGKVLSIVEQLFVHRGGTVFKAADGLVGAERYDRERPSRVMPDLEMPGLSGVDVLEFILARDPDAIVIMLSGKGEIEPVVTCLRSGAENFLSKPLETRHCELVVDRTWEKSELRRSNRDFAGLQVRNWDPGSPDASPVMRELVAIAPRRRNCSASLAKRFTIASARR